MNEWMNFCNSNMYHHLQNGCPLVIVRNLKIDLCCCFRVQWPWHTTLLYMTLPIWKQTMCSKLCISYVTCTTAGLALSEFLLLARWVLCETQVTDRNACIWRGYVERSTWYSVSFTINRPMIHQHSVYSYMSKDSYMFCLWMVVIIRLCIKELKRYLQVQFVVWDHKLYISVVLYISLELCTVKFEISDYKLQL